MTTSPIYADPLTDRDSVASLTHENIYEEPHAHQFRSLPHQKSDFDVDSSKFQSLDVKVPLGLARSRAALFESLSNQPKVNFEVVQAIGPLFTSKQFTVNAKSSDRDPDYYATDHDGGYFMEFANQTVRPEIDRGHSSRKVSFLEQTLDRQSKLDSGKINKSNGSISSVSGLNLARFFKSTFSAIAKCSVEDESSGSFFLTDDLLSSSDLDLFDKFDLKNSTIDSRNDTGTVTTSVGEDVSEIESVLKELESKAKIVQKERAPDEERVKENEKVNEKPEEDGESSCSCCSTVTSDSETLSTSTSCSCATISTCSCSTSSRSNGSSVCSCCEKCSTCDVIQ